jgi:acyl carrier protein
VPVSSIDLGWDANLVTRTFVLEAKIERLLSELLLIPAESITDDLAMKDVDVWDSLKHMELIVSLEESFSIQLSFDEIVAMQNVREIKRVLREREAAS